MSATVTETAVLDALRRVMDPELGMNVVDLGLVYGVTTAPGRVAVDLTMTSPACPLGSLIVADAEAAIAAATPPGTAIRVSLVWEPPWSPERLSDKARRELGWDD